MLGIGRDLCSTDDFQNPMDCSLYHPWPLQKISSKSVHCFLSNLGNTDIKINTQNAVKNITSTRVRFGGDAVSIPFVHQLISDWLGSASTKPFGLVLSAEGISYQSLGDERSTADWPWSISRQDHWTIDCPYEWQCNSSGEPEELKGNSFTGLKDYSIVKALASHSTINILVRYVLWKRNILADQNRPNQTE